jgi:hypothetical protein
MPKILNKRGTRANLNTLATANGLSAGEVYLITDENKIAIGLSSSTYEAFAKESSNTFTGTQTFSGTSTTLAAILTNAAEKTTISSTAATGTIAYYTATQSVMYYTTNASANWTLNLRHSVGTTLNTAMVVGQTITVTFMVTNGASAFYNNVVQVDGTTVTPKWQGGTAPSSGNVSSIDVYTYAIIKTADATFTVLATVTKFA